MKVKYSMLNHSQLQNYLKKFLFSNLTLLLLFIIIGCQSSPKINSKQAAEKEAEAEKVSSEFTGFIVNCVKEKMGEQNFSFNSLYQPNKEMYSQLDEQINSELLKSGFEKVEDNYRYRAINDILNDRYGITDGDKDFGKFKSLDFVYLLEDEFKEKSSQVDYHLTVKVIRVETSSQICSTLKKFTLAKKDFTALPDNENPPLWYGQMDSQTISGIYYGYGKGSTLEEAKSSALDNLTKQTHGEAGNELRDKEFVKKMKPEKIEMRNDNHYVAYLYDSRPLAKKMLGNFTKEKNPSQYSKNKNDFFHQLPFSKQLKNEKRKIDYELEYKNREWKLVVGNSAHSISRTEWYQNFFIAKNSKEIPLKITPENQLRNNDYYFIEVHPKRSGFLSLFTVTEDGKVQLLGEANSKVTTQKIVYPNPEDYDGLVAENLADKKKTRDLVLAVLCDKKNSRFNSYQEISSDSVNPEDNRLFTYGRLIKGMEGCSWSSEFLNISK